MAKFSDSVMFLCIFCALYIHTANFSTCHRKFYHAKQRNTICSVGDFQDKTESNKNKLDALQKVKESMDLPRIDPVKVSFPLSWFSWLLCYF